MCHLCSKTFLHRSSFNLHIKTHGDIRPHKCQICEKAFLQKAKLAVHMQSHTGERPVRIFLWLHPPKHPSTHSYTHPPTPHFTSDRRTILDWHFDIKGMTPFCACSFQVKCPVCDKGYTKRYHVRKHLKNFHKIVDVDAVLGSRKRGFEREPVPYHKLQQIKKE